MKTILIIDDEFGIVDVSREILTDEGYDVMSADNGRTGIEALRAHQPQLVILDLMMPIVSGKRVLAFMRAEPFGLPAQALSPHRTAQHPQKAPRR